jgi:hypothetical protein
MLTAGSSVELGFGASMRRGDSGYFVGVNVAQPAVQSTMAIPLATMI